MYIIVTALSSFFITFFLIPALIPLLRRIKFGQAIRTDGPESHLKKQGTPVMGGIIFILVPIFVFFLTGNMFLGDWKIQVILLAFLGYGLIGFIDDYLVVVKKSNDGLRARDKFILQSILAIILIFISSSYLDPIVNIPFTSIQVNIGILYPMICFLMFTATSNGTNLSDGLDGLCAGLSIIALTGFTIICYRIGYYQIALFLVAVIASLLAYLYYNKAPARIFMGDVGSLSLGGLLAAVGLVTHHEFMVAILGFVFVIEILSVVIQILSVKLTGKRVFKMAPLHHHFELSGMSETSVVFMFWMMGLISLLFGLMWEFFF